MSDHANVPHLCASTILRQFRFDHRPQSPAFFAWKKDLTTFVARLLSETQVDPLIALTSLCLLGRYNLFIRRKLPLAEVHQIVFAAFMLATKILIPRTRVLWALIGEGLLEGSSVLWLERGFLIDIRWDDEMLSVVEEVWAAYSEARQTKADDCKTMRRLSKTSSMTTISDEDHADVLSTPFRTPLIHSPLKKADQGKRTANFHSPRESSLRRTYLKQGPSLQDRSQPPAQRYLDVIVPHEEDTPTPKLRNRVSQMFRKGG